MRTLLLLLTLVLAAPVQARMYQWVSPQSGTTQLSGMPPPWYRSGTPGPRVFVFDDGRIIDDTAIKVTPAERERLREQAFRQADELAKAAPAAQVPEPASAAATAKTATESPDQQAEEAEAEAAAEPASPDGGSAQSAATRKNASTQSTIERLKAIIADWDRRQTEHAKDVLDTQNQLKQMLKASPPPANANPPDTGP